VTFLAAADSRPTRAQDSPPAPPQESAVVYLLEVRVNDWPLQLVARFVEQDGRLRIPVRQFEGLGFLPRTEQPVEIDGEQWLWLDQLPGFRWTIDRANQVISIQAPYAAIEPTTLRVAPGVPRVETRADWGAMLGWDVFGQWSLKPDDPLFTRSWSAHIDTRIFSPKLTAVSRGYFFGGEGSDARFLRLESYVDYDNVDKSWRLRVGDSLTGGPSFIRVVRFGGIQFSRDYALRPDIITTPVPELNQDISAPSTVDVFVNGVERYSTSVNPGPLQLRDLPIVTGSNTVRAVITDRSGKRTELNLPFYVGDRLLVKGMSDFSVAAGFPRENYNVVSNDYGQFFASGAYRRGISDTVTLTGYAAVSKGYWTAGGGAATQIADFAEVNGVVLYSDAPDEDGWMFAVGAARYTRRVNFIASYLRTYSYTDLARLNGYVPRIERITASFGLNLDRAGQINTVYTRTLTADNSLSEVISATYGLDLGRRQRFRVSVSGYGDIPNKSWSAYVSLSIPLKSGTQIYAQGGLRDGNPNAQLQVQGMREREGDRLDWQLNGAWERGLGYSVDAYSIWENRWATLYGRATRANESTGLEGEIAQSLILMDGRFFLTRRIDDSFAVVTVPDSPGVSVALENNSAGRTGKSGRILLTGLQPYVPNAISIDPLDLPIDAAVSDTNLLVSPHASGGLVARFEVERAYSAIVVLQLPDGSEPPPGALVRMTDSAFAEPIGYGGEIYVRGLKEGANRLDVVWRNGQCSATFNAEVTAGTLPRLGPFQCVP